MSICLDMGRSMSIGNVSNFPISSFQLRDHLKFLEDYPYERWYPEHMTSFSLDMLTRWLATIKMVWPGFSPRLWPDWLEPRSPDNWGARFTNSSSQYAILGLSKPHSPDIEQGAFIIISGFELTDNCLSSCYFLKLGD